jgi:hypothetical protein
VSFEVFRQFIDEMKFNAFNKDIKTGIVYAHNFDFTQKQHTADILFAMDSAKKKFDADAVYFHVSANKEYSVPQVYLFDNTSKKYCKNLKNELHKKMWNSSQVPLYIIVDQTIVNIYDSRKMPDIKSENYAEAIIQIVAKSLSQFNAREFDNGLFWEKNEKNNFNLWGYNSPPLCGG